MYWRTSAEGSGLFLRGMSIDKVPNAAPMGIGLMTTVETRPLSHTGAVKCLMLPSSRPICQPKRHTQLARVSCDLSSAAVRSK